ncbi:MAG: putative membrane protein [Parcubacteria group bacterium Athens0714_26]|nr:MAG: putative membrane protein [Parcubacteria group bacterium Athens0714_26]
MRKLFIQVIAGISGLWLASQFVSGIEFTGKLTTLALAGLTLGLLNYFVKPILKGISLPLRILTLNLFTIVISMGLLWVVDLLFTELKIVQRLTIQGLAPLFWTTLIIWAISLILSSFIRSKPKLSEPSA